MISTNVEIVKKNKGYYEIYREGTSVATVTDNIGSGYFITYNIQRGDYVEIKANNSKYYLKVVSVLPIRQVVTFDFLTFGNKRIGHLQMGDILVYVNSYTPDTYFIRPNGINLFNCKRSFKGISWLNEDKRVVLTYRHNNILFDDQTFKDNQELNVLLSLTVVMRRIIEKKLGFTMQSIIIVVVFCLIIYLLFFSLTH